MAVLAPMPSASVSDRRGREAGLPAAAYARRSARPARGRRRAAARGAPGVMVGPRSPAAAARGSRARIVVAELGERQALRLLGRRRRRELPPAVVEMLRQLVDDLRSRAGRSREARKAPARARAVHQAWSSPVIRFTASTNARHVLRCAASTFRPSAVTR